jgi:hypothetical protein
MIQDSDYVLLNNEIKNTEKLVRDSTVKSLTMSDKMYNILSKYQGTIFLFTDIIEYYSSIRDLDPKSNCWIFFKILIFDKKNKKLLFYNTATVLNKAHFSHYRYQNFKRALHKFVRKNEDGQNSLYGNKLSIIRMVHPEFMQK